MPPTISSDRRRALSLSVVLIVSLITITPLAGNADAAVSSGSLTVTETAVTPTESITVEGTVSSTGDVTFLIQDPNDADAATVTRTVSNTDFTETIDLSSLTFGDGLDDGTATIAADEGSSFVATEDATTFTVDSVAPTADIQSPADEANWSTADTISGTAADNVAVETVGLSIQRANGDYYDGSSWVASETFVSPSGTTSWSYDTGGAITTDGTYNLTVKVTDSAGTTRSYATGPPAPQLNEDTDTLQVNYTLDTTAPTVTSVNVRRADGTDTVAVGETINVSATVTDGTAGVETVTVDASPLGGSSSLALSQNAGDTYYETFTVSSPSTDDGSVSLTVTGTDYFDNNNTGSDSVTLDTAIDSVESLELHQQFLGVVADTNASVRITAAGVRDPQGNLIASNGAATETATLQIAGTTYSVDVDEGAIDTTIDPTEISDSATTGETTVEIAEADSQSANDSVELVHEASGLDEGYQLEGTPMDAEDVVFQYVGDAVTYDPTVENPWVPPSETEAGEGYYVYGENDSARIGYTFQQSGQLRSEYLDEGYNLVGVTRDLNDGDSVQITDDLGDGITVQNNANVKVYTRDTSTDLNNPSGETDASAFSEASWDTSVSSYESYFVYVDSGQEVRIVDEAGYEAGQGS